MYLIGSRNSLNLNNGGRCFRGIITIFLGSEECVTSNKLLFDIGADPDHDLEPGILTEFLPMRERDGATVRILQGHLPWRRFTVSKQDQIYRSAQTVPPNKEPTEI